MSENIIKFKRPLNESYHRKLKAVIDVLDVNCTDEKYIGLRVLHYPHHSKHPHYAGYVAGFIVAKIMEVRDVLSTYLAGDSREQIPESLEEILDEIDAAFQSRLPHICIAIPFTESNVHLILSHYEPLGYVVTSFHKNHRCMGQYAAETFMEKNNLTVNDIFYID